MNLLKLSHILILLSFVSFSSATYADISSLLYDASKTYSQGDPVTLELYGAIYTAKATVPANTPPPNPDFWADDEETTSGFSVPTGEPNIDTTTLETPGSTPSQEPPSFSTSLMEVNYNENNTSYVVEIIASNATSYELSDELDGDVFDIEIVNSTAFFLKFKNSPNFEQPEDADLNNVYEVIATASNITGPTAMQTIKISVQNVIEQPVITSSSTADFDSGASGIVYTATATDNSTFSLSGTDSLLFTINSATGDLTFNSTPDYNNPADFNSDNVYDIVIVAENDSGTSFLNLSVEINQPVLASAKLANLSTRGFVGTGDSVMIAGFIVSGSGSTEVTIRALGPTIAAPPFNVAGTITDPVLTIVDGTGAVVASNDNWADFSLASEIESGGRAPSSQNEAVVRLSVTQGNYTAIVTGAGGATGVSLVEVYDEGTGGSSIELSNLSTRGYVGTGDSVMIAGFIVGGEVGSTSTVTVRALGPTIAAPPFNVSGTITDPVLTIVDGLGAVVASVDNWETSSSASAITSSSRNPSNTVESAHQFSVSPGNYTAIVTGAGGNTGVSLVEVYKE